MAEFLLAHFIPERSVASFYYHNIRCPSLPYHRIQQSTQTPVGDFTDVGGEEGAEEPKHDQVHRQNQQNTVENSEIKTSLQITQTKKI